MMGILWSGIVSGSLYALGALGLVLIFKSTKVLNFAFGNQAGLAAFVVYGLTQSAQLSWGVSVLAAVAVSLGVAGLVCLLVYPIALRSDVAAVIATLGCGLVLQGVTVLLFGTGIVSLDLPIGTGTIRLGGLLITRYDIVVVASAVLLITAIYILVERTRLGIVFRAVASAPEASRVAGVSLLRVHVGSWLGASLLGVAGALLIVPTTYLSPVTVPTFMLQAFIAAAIGGFESLPGSVVGGLAVGILLNLFNYYVSPEYTSSFMVVLVMVLLTVFPGGFFSERVTGRA